MSSKTKAAITSITDFIRGKKPPLPFDVFYLRPFERLFDHYVKQSRSFAKDFTKFLENFDPDNPHRGENVHSTCASKTDFGREDYSARRGYRVIYYYDEKKALVVLLMLFAKNEKTDIDHDEARDIAELVRLIQKGELPLTPLG